MSTLDTGFLRAVILTTSWRGDDMARAQAALLLIGLRLQDFTAGHLPKEICGESKSLAGCATGSLISQGLLEVTGRVKSPNPDANGRKCNQLRIPANKVGLAKLWLSRHGYAATETEQLSLAV